MSVLGSLGTLFREIEDIVSIEHDTESEDADDSWESGHLCENVCGIADEKKHCGLGDTLIMQQKPKFSN